jgi:phytoene dehydrogenase-like protein
MAESYDVVIVGAGHNGLVAAAYLAKAGKKTLVVERRDGAGGIVATEEFAPGFKSSIGPDLIGLLRPRVIQDLELERHGLEIINLDPSVFLPLPDGGHFTLWRDREKTLQEIERHSKADAQVYPKFVDLVQSVTGFMKKAFSKPTPRPESRETRDLLNLLQLGWNLRRLGTKNMQQTLRILPTSIADVLNEWFESEPLKACLASQGIVGVSMGPRSFGTAVVFLYHQFEEKGWPWTSWGLPRGGMGSVSRAIVRSAESLGVKIRTKANVSRILVKDGRATGVVLEDGEEISAGRVVSNTDPGTTFLELIEPTYLEAEFLKKVERIRYRGVTAKLNLALEELPDFTCLPGKDPAAHHRGVIQIGPDLDYLERAYDHVKYRRPSERPWKARDVHHHAVRPVPYRRRRLARSPDFAGRYDHRHAQRVRTQPEGSRSPPAGTDSSRLRRSLWSARGEFSPWGDLDRSALPHEAGCRVVALSHTDSEPLPLRIGNPPGRWCQRSMRLQRQPPDSRGLESIDTTGLENRLSCVEAPSHLLRNR